MKKLSLITQSLALSCFLHLVTLANDNPLKVFILCGQSNMEGHAKISTFEALKMDPVTKPIYKQMVDSMGDPVTCEKVWISYFTGGRDNMGEGYGKLTAGYGSRRVPGEIGEKIGPEFTFGIYAQKALKESILIIKTAWGGKSLFKDFRPPSSKGETGEYYTKMVEEIRAGLDDFSSNAYELGGFIWMQGWNDMVSQEATACLLYTSDAADE